MAPTISAVSKISASPGKKILVERNETARSTIPFSDVKSLIMEDNRSTQDIASKRKALLFSCDDNESTPYIGLNQKLSFFDVKSIIMEDSESTQQTDSKLNNVEVPRGYKESLKSSDDSLKKALPEESTPEIAFKPKTVSFSDVRSLLMEDNESTQQTGLKQNNVEGPYEYKQPLKSKAVLLMENLPEEKGSVKVIPRVEISPKVSILAPLDADPLMIPYDPKTNYLSPRPQFLHYRPNPRIEIYRERDRKQLEECFATESYSDTDLTEETQPEDSQREPEDISSEETNPIAADMVEESFEAKEMNNPRFSTRSKFIALLMVLAFAYFSVLAANTPAFTSSRLEELSLLNFRVPPEVIGFAKAKFEVLTENLQHWLDRFLSYVSNKVSSSREGDRFTFFEYANLSHLLEDDHMIEGHHNLMFDHCVTVTEPEMERNVGSELFYDNMYYGEIEADEALDEDEELEDQNDEDFKNSEPVSEEETDADEAEEQEQEQKNEDFNTLELVSEEESVAVEQEIGTEIEPDQLEASIIIPQATEIQPDLSKTGVPESDELNNIAATMLPEEDFTYSSQSSVDDSTSNRPEERFLTKIVTCFALLVLCLASALIYTKRVKTIHEMQSPRNWKTEMDMGSESLSSDTSSCHRNSSCYNKKGHKEPNDEYQSQQRKTRKTYRRESLASSDYSSGSFSYGSFTTYDKIPSKHGGGDEGIFTPVRRSSRIRNQAISP